MCRVCTLCKRLYRLTSLPSAAVFLVLPKYKAGAGTDKYTQLAVILCNIN